MSEQIVNAMEIFMMGVLVVTRIAGTCAIVWMLIEATSISEGWKVFLIAAALVLGLAFNLHYDNPNNHKPQTTKTAEERTE